MFESDDSIVIEEPGLYVAAFFDEETNYRIAEYLRINNIPMPVTSASLHTTIVYSKVPVTTFEPNHSVDIGVNTKHASFECWDMRNGARCLVLKYFSPYLHMRFEEAMKAGAMYDFDEYKPHVTLSYSMPEDFDVATLPALGFPLKIVGEYSEPIIQDWCFQQLNNNLKNKERRRINGNFRSRV